MFTYQLLENELSDVCQTVHASRLKAVLEVAAGLQKSRSLSQAAIGRNLPGTSEIKHKIKKVDRLEGNSKLHAEFTELYTGLSQYVFKYLTTEKHSPLIVDLCYIQDNHEIQMLSAEVASKGRTIPIYRELFGQNELKGRAKKFICELKKCLPEGQEIVFIMDAGFGEDWIQAIEDYQWQWVLRLRKGKYIKLNNDTEWMGVGELMPHIGDKARSYEKGSITKQRPHLCRIITKGAPKIIKRTRPKKTPRNYNSANGGYSKIAREPWILASNLPKSYTATHILNYYKKRMQIEESFRDIKNTRNGLSARHANTKCIHRWGVKMLLAAIVQIIYWIIGIIGHSLNYQRKFQANTVKNKKIFSYFSLGRLIIEHDMLSEISIDYEQLPNIVNAELAKAW